MTTDKEQIFISNNILLSLYGPNLPIYIKSLCRLPGDNKVGLL
jgi:hypothetical protein